MGTRKLGRKIVSLLMVMVMVLSFEMVAWAAPAQIHNQELFVVQYEKLKMDGIEQFFSKNINGTMKFDKEAARGAGYTNETIEYVSGNVDGINDMILTQGAILADDFSATIYMKSNRAAKGESKVVAWPYGPVQIYMNSEEAAEISEVLEGLSWVCSILSLISLSKKAKPILGEACGVASFIGGILISMYTAQLRVAEKGGKGIVLNAQQADSSGTNVAVWIHSQ